MITGTTWAVAFLCWLYANSVLGEAFTFTILATDHSVLVARFSFTSVNPLKLDKNRDLTLLHFRCVYEDKYIVSYNEGITPVKRTLQFDTKMGKFDVDMKLYKEAVYSYFPL
ncbi:Oidioi.mRNA.OKI2018_I69.XSR.g13515.t1.cds [Oikopleura dioica]|uniref:Oidioi.mRNA.OKI2018_I69.XSR.g13515.t1.cds n=1 Tax=Oikopleura dioica TaxID=34765 RepID=A0ABN7S7L4_OIKDI|nr:Oidioi.mRNA.OKI2018_I69.XSR.g13515.t1.cds [Oikopleura dioica]